MDSSKFTHLTKSQPIFPHTNNGDVSATLSTFDYSVWTVDTEIVACRVPWDSAYNNVVKFESESERDEYFESKKTENNTFFLTSMQNLQNNGSIRLPIPFDVMAQSNYLRVTFPEQPVPSESQSGIKTWYYFITDVRQIAPSTTECYIALDYWTTFIDEIDIQYMMLERGHAPMVAAPTPEDYLKDPINNSKYLLAQDVNFGAIEQDRYSKLGDFLLYAGDKTIYAVLATTTRTGSNLYGTLEQDDMALPAVYVARFGEYTSVDYIAVPASDLESLIYDIREHLPYFMETIVACFYMPSNLVELTDEFTIAGHKVNWIRVPALDNTLTTLTVDSFGYDSKYKDITKLYTSPYASVKIFDDNGNEKTVHIETMTSDEIRIQASINLCGAVATASATVINVGGEGYNALTHYYDDINRTIPSAGYDLLFEWNIPQFAIFEDWADKVKYDRYWIGNKEGKVNYESTRLAYDNAQRSAKTSRDNTKDMNATVQTNTKTQNSTVYTNVLASNATTQSNTKNMNTVNLANVKRTNSTNVANTKRSANLAQANTALNNALSTAITEKANENSLIINNLSSLYQTTINKEEMTIANAINSLNSNAAAATQQNNNIAAAKNGQLDALGAVGSAYATNPSIFMTDDALSNNVTSLASLGASMYYAASTSKAKTDVSIAQSSANTIITLNANTEITKETNHLSAYRVEQTNASSHSITIQENEQATYVTEQSNKTATEQASNAYNVAVNNATAARTMSNRNATNTKNQSDSNADRTKSTSDANAKRTKDTSDDNADRTKNTSDSNADNTYTTTVANAKDTRDTSRKNFDSQTNQQKIQAPIQYGRMEAPHAVSRPYGIVATLEKQSDAAIAMAGDQFLRYGYIYQGAWTPTDWNLRKKFTYWKAGDLWINCTRPGMENAGNAIEQILLNGVTVWRNPDDIGCTSIYDN